MNAFYFAMCSIVYYTTTLCEHACVCESSVDSCINSIFMCVCECVSCMKSILYVNIHCGVCIRNYTRGNLNVGLMSCGCTQKRSRIYPISMLILTR